MNARHAATLALIGWCLMVPPVHVGTAMGSMGFNQNTYSFDAAAQLSEWWNQGTFETQLDCQKGRIANINNARYAEKPDPGKTVLYRAMLKAVCIASDDPRLKEK